MLPDSPDKGGARTIQISELKNLNRSHSASLENIIVKSDGGDLEFSRMNQGRAEDLKTDEVTHLSSSCPFV